VDPNLRPAAAQAAEQAGVPLPSMREALASIRIERPSLVAALGLAAQYGWDEQVLRLSANLVDSLRVLRYLDDLLSVSEAAVAAARHENTVAEDMALNDLGEAYRGCVGSRRPSPATRRRWRSSGRPATGAPRAVP
jgi:hypothetical protein